MSASKFPDQQAKAALLGAVLVELDAAPADERQYILTPGAVTIRRRSLAALAEWLAQEEESRVE